MSYDNQIFHMDRKTYINFTSPKIDQEYQLETYDFDFGQCLLLSIETGFKLNWDWHTVTMEMIQDVWDRLSTYYDLPNIYRIHEENSKEEIKYNTEYYEEYVDPQGWWNIPWECFIDIHLNLIENQKTPTREYALQKYEKELDRI